MAADKRNINELISLIERNKVATGQTNWYRTGDPGSADAEEEDEEEEEESGEEDYSDARLLIFATQGPFTESLFPMLDQHEISYAVTDELEKAIDIAIEHQHIRHVLIDLDKPTNPSKGMDLFSELKMANPGAVIFYCTKNPMTMESRNIQNKGAKLIQKPILRKTVDQFVLDNFKC